MPSLKLRLLVHALVLTPVSLASLTPGWASEGSQGVLASLFERDESIQLDRAVAVTLDSCSYAELREKYDAKQNIIVTRMPLTRDRDIDLNLRPVDGLPRTAVVVAADGQTLTIRLEYAIFSGFIQDQPNSYAYLAITPTMINGYFYFDDKTYVLSSGDPRNDQHGKAMIADASDLLRNQPGNDWCRVLDVSTDYIGDQGRQSLNAPGPVVRISDMFIECDHQLRAVFDTSEDAAAYVVTLLAATSEIYRRDLGVVMRVPEGYLRVWESIPPWGRADGWGALEPFIEYWSSVVNPLRDLPRTGVHLLTNPVFGGIAAGFGGLCSQQSGYDLSSVNGFFPYPIEHLSPDNYDLFVVSHEFGHSFGSVHTFDYLPEIECEDGSGPDSGTIMSYCAQSAVGMRFHARVQDTIRSYAAGMSCVDVVDVQPGDYNYDGSFDTTDLQAALMCVNLEFESAGCLETFDLNNDGELTMCDYALLEAVVDPQEQMDDCNDNHVPDDCEDCNGNGLADECDIADGTSTDCNDNGVPDECEAGSTVDCNNNGILDLCDIFSGTSLDENDNGVPDECQSVIYVDVVNCTAPGSGTDQDPFCTIQDGINAAVGGDTVLLADGTYVGEWNKHLDFGGKPIIVQSANGPVNCIVDGEGAGRGFIFQNGESSNTRVIGLTITNCSPLGVQSVGGGIYCLTSSPTISNCIITGNAAARGGGIACQDSSAPNIVDCLINNNSGGGIYCYNQSNPVVLNCVISENTSNQAAGIDCEAYSSPTISRCEITGNQPTGIHCAVNSNPTIRHCRIAGNEDTGIYCNTSVPEISNCLITGNSGIGIELKLSSNVMISNCTIANNMATTGSSLSCYASASTVRNSILWTNDPVQSSEISLTSHSTLNLEYCDIRGGMSGVSSEDEGHVNWLSGNISADPLFYDPANNNYHLRLESPCIEAGDPGFVAEAGETDLDGNPRVMFSIVDMGVDEAEEFVDCNDNGIIDWQDISNGISADLNANGFPDECETPLFIYVDDNAPNDPGPGDPTVSDPYEYGSWDHPYDAIQEAIDVARDIGDANPDESFIVQIVVADGTYAGPGNRDLDVYGRPYTLRSARGPTTCTIDCQGSPEDPHRGFYFQSGETIGTRVEGFTITNGVGVWGGGICCLDSSPTISNCVIMGNRATDSNGGGVAGLNSRLVISGCIITGNVAAGDGGGIFLVSWPTPFDAEINNCIISGNSSNLRGGGILLSDLGSVQINNSIISGNSTADNSYGGGIYSSNLNDLTLTNCTISGNSSHRGGGMYSRDLNNLTLTNCAITGNSRISLGGGMCTQSTGNVMLRNCTIAGNMVESFGGGIYQISGRLVIVNGILWGNSGVVGPQISTMVKYLLVEFSDVESGEAGVHAAGHIDWGEGNIDADPLFVDADGLDDIPGTKDDDLRLSAGSPAIDAADNMIVPSEIVTDLDGNDRFVDDPDTPDTGNPDGINPIVDMGAYEFQPPIIALLDIKPGACPNPFNRNSHGVLPVGLVGEEDFDVNQVVLSSLLLSRADGVGGQVAPLDGPRGHHSVFEDEATQFDGEQCSCHALGGDGTVDLSMKFRTHDLVEVLELDELPGGTMVELVLTGNLLDESSFVASDCIVIVPQGSMSPVNVVIESNVADTFIEITPLDLNLDGDGFASFGRSYYIGTVLTATAPETTSGHTFYRWIVDGVLLENGVRTIDVTVTGDAAFRAVYMTSPKDPLILENSPPSSTIPLGERTFR